MINKEVKIAGMKTSKCPKCGNYNIIGVKRCGSCNTLLKNYNYTCPRCGKKYADKFVKCSGCGYSEKRGKIVLILGLIFSILFVVGLIYLLNKYNFSNAKDYLRYLIIGLCFILLIRATKNYNKAIEYKDIESETKLEKLDGKKSKNK